MAEKITSHKVNGLNDALRVTALGDPGPGGAHVEYTISADMKGAAEDHPAENSRRIRACCRLHFQNGVIEPNGDGINGISIEAILAVAEHRLQGFQSGEFACRENAVALTKLQESMMWLHKRTRDRMERGVEGTLAE